MLGKWNGVEIEGGVLAVATSFGRYGCCGKEKIKKIRYIKNEGRIARAAPSCFDGLQIQDCA